MTALEARLGGGSGATMEQAPVASTEEDDFDLFGSEEVCVLGKENWPCLTASSAMMVGRRGGGTPREGTAGKGVSREENKKYV